MELRDNYKIENDGIWISRSELEKWKKHYLKVADEYKQNQRYKSDLSFFKFPYYLGKAGVLTDLLKMFEPLEGE